MSTFQGPDIELVEHCAMVLGFQQKEGANKEVMSNHLGMKHCYSVHMPKIILIFPVPGIL